LADLSGEDRLVTSPDAGQSAAPSPAVRALLRFAERSPATQADIDEVMRALVSHDGWYVPAAFADRAWGQTTFESTVLLGDAQPNPVLTVFTDRASAKHAEGQPLGAFGGPVAGVRLMRVLDGNLAALFVNPASPREQQWYIAAAGFDIAITWATAIVVERVLAERGDGPVPAQELLGHRYQLLLERPSQARAEVHLPDLGGPFAVCFTAADRVDEFLQSLPATARPLAETAAIDGPQLFDMLYEAGVTGLVVNAGSDDQTALSREDIAAVASLRSVSR
jgi:hypothetical protein